LKRIHHLLSNESDKSQRVNLGLLFFKIQKKLWALRLIKKADSQEHSTVSTATSFVNIPNSKLILHINAIQGEAPKAF